MMTPIDIAGARILIVDDDALMRGLASSTLRHAGFDVSEADGGAQALALFEQRPFDLMLLDVMMPDMDGYQVCARIRRLPEGARVPILMLTGLNDTQSIELAYQAGATDFISKPINWTLLSHRVRYSLRAGMAVEIAMRSRERLERAQSIANMGSWEMAMGGQSFACSNELGQIFGALSESILCASPQAFLDRVCDADRPAVQAARELAEREGRPYQLTFKIQRFDGVQRTVYEQCGPVMNSAGRQVAIEGITQDVTDRVDAQNMISRLARYDSLTGLPNLRFFDELAGPSLERSLRLNTTCALAYLDIDRFKTVNDAMGHKGGDAVLIKMANRLRACIRAPGLGFPGRIASESVVARVGGNTFALMLVGTESDQQAGAVAEYLMRSISEPIAASDGELVLTASAGVALFPRDAPDILGLTRCAEQALHAAKAAGRSQHRFFDEAMNESASVRLTQERDLRRAIGEGQLRLHYQPKVNAVGGVIVGVEALVRWQHPSRGLIAPGEFIALAEESGQIVALTDWVLETVCADIRRWRDAGLPVVPVAVNLASTCFANDAMEEELMASVRHHGLTASDLVLEVTESLLMTDVDRIVQRLDALRKRGFGVSLDDFGTGFSSLSYLKQFPIDELKIDRSFVTDAWRGGRDSAIATSIIALGRAFGVRVVAEGVETAEQADCLLAMGCPIQQGYLFARPMAREALEPLLRRGLTATPSGAAGH